MKKFRIRITGKTPIVLHSDRAVNPNSPYKNALKELTSIRKKTDEDMSAIARLEFESALHSNKGMIAVTSIMMQESIRCGAALNRNGKKVERGVEVFGTLDDQMNYSALDYSNSGKVIKNIPDLDDMREGEIPCEAVDKLYNKTFIDGRCVVVSQARIWKVRPKFPAGWKAEFDISYDDTIINKKDLLLSIENAGSLMGIGSMRKLRMGRFSFEVIK